MKTFPIIPHPGSLSMHISEKFIPSSMEMNGLKGLEIKFIYASMFGNQIRRNYKGKVTLFSTPKKSLRRDLTMSNFLVTPEGSNRLADGAYVATIEKLETRVWHDAEKNEDVQYLDFHFKFDAGATIRQGVPFRVTPDTRLGALLKRFTAWEVGKALNLEEVFVGKRVSVYVENEQTGKGTFARVQMDTVMPAI